MSPNRTKHCVYGYIYIYVWVGIGCPVFLNFTAQSDTQKFSRVIS